MTSQSAKEDERKAESALLSFFQTVYSEEKAANLSKRLLLSYQSLSRILAASPAMLIAEIGEEAALYLKLSLSLFLRRTTEALREGDTVDEGALTRHFCALYRDCGQETVYALLTDNKGRMLARHVLSAGSVEGSSILPRQILELAVRAGASGVYLLHNHPGGDLSPSVSDERITKAAALALSAARIDFHGHYIFCGADYIRLDKSGAATKPMRMKENSEIP